MENQNNQTSEHSDEIRKWGLLGIAAAVLIYGLSKGDNTRRNPDSEDDTDSKKSEPETVKKSAEGIEDDITMKVRKSAEHEKGNWLAILCRADGKESDQCFFGDTKKETIEKAFKEAISCYREAIDE